MGIPGPGELVIEQGQLQCHDELLTALEELASKSSPTKTWVDAFIKPVQV